MVRFLKFILSLWSNAPRANKDRGIEIQSVEIYERYMKYLTGYAQAFRSGWVDVNQFTLEKWLKKVEP